jgi:hypothetical protein
MSQRDVESFADVIQYYTGNYVLSRVDPTLMYCVYGQGLSAKSAYVYVYKNGKRLGDGPENMTETDINKSFQWGLPSIGMSVFDDKELVYLYYKTARTGDRGFSIGERHRNDGRVLSYSFNGSKLRSAGLPATASEQLREAAGAWHALTQQRHSLDVAWKDLTSKLPKRLAYALSYKFGVYLTDAEYPVLCYKLQEIGDVCAANKVRIYAKDKEYTDLVRRVLNPKMEIEVV